MLLTREVIFSILKMEIIIVGQNLELHIFDFFNPLEMSDIPKKKRKNIEIIIFHAKNH